ncbi:MAG: serine/threonine-protein kinase, partial [Alloprevotella sp.]
MADKIQKEGMLKVGTLLANGKYRIDQYLASGGFGNTYVATDMAFDENVAIKELFIKGVCGRTAESAEISVSLSENQRAFSAQREKFRKEAKRIRKLNNPHIISVHDLFDENGTSYYVMDFVEGESLSARLKRTKKPMSEAELMLLVPQVLDALECVHAESIWHLDLKPANIMVDAKGNVQLIDFGASKQLKNSNGDSLSTSSAMAYTAGYASSEQMEQNIDKFGPWTDLYSLGATMYNLLTMQQPPSPSDIDEDSRTALKLPKGISKKTERLIFWLMKPNRKMRPQSVTDVKQFLVEANDSPRPNIEIDEDEDGDTIVTQKKPKASTPPTPPTPPTP